VKPAAEDPDRGELPGEAAIRERIGAGDTLEGGQPFQGGNHFSRGAGALPMRVQRHAQQVEAGCGNHAGERSPEERLVCRDELRRWLAHFAGRGRTHSDDPLGVTPREALNNQRVRPPGRARHLQFQLVETEEGDLWCEQFHVRGGSSDDQHGGFQGLRLCEVFLEGRSSGRISYATPHKAAQGRKRPLESVHLDALPRTARMYDDHVRVAEVPYGLRQCASGLRVAGG